MLGQSSGMAFGAVPPRSASSSAEAAEVKQISVPSCVSLTSRTDSLVFRGREEGPIRHGVCTHVV